MRTEIKIGFRFEFLRIVEVGRVKLAKSVI